MLSNQFWNSLNMNMSIANTAYTQGKLSSRKTNSLAIAFVSIALTLATLFVIS
jgi:hypothetical protein